MIMREVCAISMSAPLLPSCSERHGHLECCTCRGKGKRTEGKKGFKIQEMACKYGMLSASYELLKQGSLQEGYKPLTHNETAMHLFENKCFRAGIIHFVKCLLSRLLLASYDHKESKQKWAEGLFISVYSHTHTRQLFILVHKQSAPAEEKWCEQEASICRPRGVHRPQGELEERKKKRRISNIDWRKVCTNRKHTDDMHWKRKYACIDDSIRGAHPIFLRLNIEIVTDPG